MKYNKLKQVAVGAGRMFDFAHSYDSALHKKYLNTQARQIESKALRSDWEKIGKDLKTAIIREADKDALKQNNFQAPFRPPKNFMPMNKLFRELLTE